MIRVNEIFQSVQGEGPNAGIKTIFLRVSGCTYRCAWCDSKYTWDKDQGEVYQEAELLQELLSWCHNTNTSNVVLTGGNPCLYDFSSIIKGLHTQGITVDVETQGDLFPGWLEDLDLIVFSPKPPSSGMMDSFYKIKEFLNTVDQKCRMCIKIPVFNDGDFEFCKKYYDLITEYRKYGYDIDLYLSVGNSDVTEDGNITDRILESYAELIEKVNASDMSRVFVLPQIHTLVWGNKTGV